MAVVKVCVMYLSVFAFLVGNVVGGRYPSPLGDASVGNEAPRQVQRRSDFPEGFVFGTSSAAYQYEGAVKEGGRGPSIWDSACLMAGIIRDNSTGDVANDHYHRYQEDIGLMADLGVDTYRFSIAWPRIFPDGRGPVANPAGIAFYNSLIDSLLSRGIEPFVTLSHYDLPQTLQDDFGGWRSRQIVPLFRSFAEAAFAAFGDRVKYWITFNEIHNFAIKYTNFGCMAPSGLCGTGNSSTWVYATGHHMLLSHASAVELYRTKFQPGTAGRQNWHYCRRTMYEPYYDSPADVEAVERLQAFQLQWVLDPIYYGRYPELLVSRLGDRLLSFSERESQSLKGSVDFIGINHYTTHYAVDQSNSSAPSHLDSGATSVGSKEGVPIGPVAGSTWLNIVPFGIHKILTYIRVRYENPVIYITENGVDEENNPATPLEVVLKDSYRIKYHLDYLSYVNAAIRDGCDVRGYFVWSLLDNFEWDDGLSKRFGIYYVDYVHNVTRHAKDSAKWFKEFLRPLLQPDHAES